jgi:hypothetical protein
MKIGILTFHFSTNYGALFQAYGLRNYLKGLGHEVEFINYQPEYLEEGSKINISNLFSKAILTIVYLKLVNFKEKYFGNKVKEKYFKEFKKDFLGIDTTKVYKTIKALEEENLYFDLLVTGSDQVWNPSEQFGVDPVYFLDFKVSNPKIKRISYAPSFGKSSIEDKFADEISQLISKLDVVSIRELSGAEIIKQLTSIESSVVPDPTALVSDYTKIMNPYEVKDKNYVFCYYLRSRDTIGKISEHIASNNNLSIYSPHNPHRRWKEIGETVNPGPREWLYLLYNSKFVVTNSFHGTMLSILLNKPFIVVGIGSGEKSKYNERALNILKLCGLENRFVSDFNSAKVDELKAEEINWIEVNMKINELKLQGTNYLNKIFLDCLNESK